jgi:DNA repair photolyase
MAADRAAARAGWKARGAVSNREGRFQHFRHEPVDDGWPADAAEGGAAVHRTVMADKARTIINYNNSPDIPFDRSINPYRGCEHGCIYCFARPTHSYLDLSPGLDFETRLFYKEDAPAMLERELSKPSYRCRPVALGINTDAYQPVEKELELTRRLLAVLWEYRHPVSLITKSRLILRDLDLLEKMARHRLVWAAVSLTSHQQPVKSTLEPRAASPRQRLEVIGELSAAGVPVGAMVAPVIPAITDHELETLLEQAYGAGAVDHFEKTRRSSEAVEIAPSDATVADRDVVVVDDIVATGSTMSSAIAQLTGPARVFVACVHPMLAANARTKLANAGVDAVYGTDTIERAVSAVSAAPAIAERL